MGGVDLADQKRSYYSLGRTSNKWWTYLFWFFTNICIVNAHILFYLSRYPAPKQKMEHLDFRLALAKRLIGGYCGYKRKYVRSNFKKILEIRDGNLSGHSCARLQGRKRKCVYCDQKGKRTSKGGKVETVFGCNLCNINLCKEGCFTSFHAEKSGKIIS